MFGLAQQLLRAFRERSWTTGGRLRADCLGRSDPRGACPALPVSAASVPWYRQGLERRANPLTEKPLLSALGAWEPGSEHAGTV